MSEITHYLYVINYWVPLPDTEYGGLVTVIAKSDEEATQLLIDSDGYFPNANSRYNHLIKNAVQNSRKFPLYGKYDSGIVEAFVT